MLKRVKKMPRPVPKPQYKRKAPRRAKRNNFTKETRKAIYERDYGMCQQCGGLGTEIHHVRFRSQSGRGVFTNGLTLCTPCHRKVHEDAELAEYWMNVFTDRYGPVFWKDEYDV